MLTKKVIMRGIKDYVHGFEYFKNSFTMKEVQDIVLSTLALGFIFHLFLSSLSDSWLYNFGIAVAMVGPAFIFHELAHKFAAIKYECKAHYVMDYQWTIMSLMFSSFAYLIGFPFIIVATGATVVSAAYATRIGYRYISLTISEIGKMNLAGPLTNIVLALIFNSLVVFNPIFRYFVTINLILAIFNLLPFPPLDGSKIFNWSPTIWAGSFASAIALMILLPFLPSIIAIPIIIGLLIAIFLIAQKLIY